MFKQDLSLVPLADHLVCHKLEYVTFSTFQIRNTATIFAVKTIPVKFDQIIKDASKEAWYFTNQIYLYILYRSSTINQIIL